MSFVTPDVVNKSIFYEGIFVVGVSFAFHFLDDAHS